MARKRVGRGRKVKTSEELQAEADQRKRNALIAVGVPSWQVDGQKVHEYETNVRHIRKPVQSIVDRWFREGGPGFDAPQKRAIEHVEVLWLCAGSVKLVANLDFVGGGGGREGGWSQAEALSLLQGYKHEFLSYWTVFEDIVRWNTPATVAGEHLAEHDGRRIEKAKQCVGMIASVIAHTRGY